jgi:hypothetical protein
MLWVMDEATGKLSVIKVKTGITNGQETEVSGPGVKEGMKIIAGVTSNDPGAAANPFQQPTQGRGGPGGRGGF